MNNKFSTQVLNIILSICRCFVGSSNDEAQNVEDCIQRDPLPTKNRQVNKFWNPAHTRNKQEKLHAKGEAFFDTPFMIQKIMMKIWRKSRAPFRIYQPNSLSYGRIGCAS